MVDALPIVHVLVVLTGGRGMKDMVHPLDPGRIPLVALRIGDIPQREAEGPLVPLRVDLVGVGARPQATNLPCRLAARFNPDLKAKYLQLIAAGKPAKLAVTAVMRKLIVSANALLKADRLWVKALA